MSFFPKGGGEGVLAEPKVLMHFFFALKQSKATNANDEKSASKNPKVRGGQRLLEKKTPI